MKRERLAHRTTLIAKLSREADRRPPDACSERSETWLIAVSVSIPRLGRTEPRKRACQAAAVLASWIFYLFQYFK